MTPQEIWILNIKHVQVWIVKSGQLHSLIKFGIKKAK